MEILDIAYKIGTYETSAQPFEDCCTVFTPRHPRTKPKAYAVRGQMHRLDVDGLIERALAGVTVERILPNGVMG